MSRFFVLKVEDFDNFFSPPPPKTLGSYFSRRTMPISAKALNKLPFYQKKRGRKKFRIPQMQKFLSMCVLHTCYHYAYYAMCIQKKRRRPRQRWDLASTQLQLGIYTLTVHSRRNTLNALFKLLGFKSDGAIVSARKRGYKKKKPATKKFWVKKSGAKNAGIVVNAIKARNFSAGPRSSNKG